MDEDGRLRLRALRGRHSARAVKVALRAADDSDMNRGLSALAVALAAVLGAFALQLEAAQRDRHDAAEQRFEERAQVSAALTYSVFSALGGASSQALRRRYDTSDAKRREQLAELVRDGTLTYAAIAHGGGRILVRDGAVEPPPRGSAPLRVLSDVRLTTAGPVVEYRVPFPTRAGERVLLQGIPLSTLRPFLESFLRRLPNPERAAVKLVDGTGTTLASIAPRAGRTPAGDGLTVAGSVPQTSWRLSLRAARSSVLAGAGGETALGWLLLGGLAIALLAALVLCARIVAVSRRRGDANRALRESEGKLRALVGALEEAVFLLYADGSVELLNASARQLAEVETDYLPEHLPDWLPFSDDGAPLTDAETPAGACLATGEPQRRIIGLDRPGRGRLWLDIKAHPLRRPGETAPYAAVCSCADVTDRQSLEAHLLDLADRDPLTALWNRRRFEQDLADQLDRCRRYGERAALVLMDLDGFKQVNDVLGHLAGDEVLCALGESLTARLRSSDRAARLGGDEFAVLLRNIEPPDVARVAAALTAESHAAIALVQDRVALSISAGTALLDASAGGVQDALEAADRAMYAEKQGREQLPSGTAVRGHGEASAEMASLRALLAAVNARDSYTAMHSRVVVTLARGVARRLGLDDAATSEVEHIALLHDLGKIAIPDAILRKPGPLTAHEQTLMRQHPVVGAQILASMPELAHLAGAVRAEHERWDGGGYPDGLAGEEIPVASRIALVCDAYHAMTSNRPYRLAMSAGAAREEIGREAGAQFCPHAAAALLEVLAGSAVHA